jgi:hypothetical protein
LLVTLSLLHSMTMIASLELDLAVFHGRSVNLYNRPSPNSEQVIASFL